MARFKSKCILAHKFALWILLSPVLTSKKKIYFFVTALSHYMAIAPRSHGALVFFRTPRDRQKTSIIFGKIEIHGACRALMAMPRLSYGAPSVILRRCVAFLRRLTALLRRFCCSHGDITTRALRSRCDCTALWRA